MQRTKDDHCGCGGAAGGSRRLDPSAQQQAPGVLSVLSKDQPVNVRDAGGRYEISVLPNGPQILGHKVIEVGQDFVVVQDIVGVTETRIPIWSIKAVTIIRQPSR